MSDPGLAVVLRTTPYGESDVVVDLLTADAGRLSAMAHGGRRSRVRFGGALDVGTRLRVRLARGRGLPSLSECLVVGAVLHARGDLDRISHLSYALEVVRLLVREGAHEPVAHRLLVGYLDALEVAPATTEALVIWELALLVHQGYALRLDACVRSGGAPDALSLSAGGAICSAAALGVPDLIPLAPAVFPALSALAEGRADVHLPPAHRLAVHRAMAQVWAQITGRALRSAEFLS